MIPSVSLLVLAVVALTALPLTAGAQVPETPGRPLMLAPLPRAQAPEAPAAPSAVDAPMAEPSPDHVQVQPLQSVDVDSVGILSTAEGGLGEAMWRGTPRALIERLLPRLPAAIDSVAMHGLARRLLLSVAVPPPAEDGDQTGALLATRVELLLRMGDFEAVEALLAATPGRADDPALARIEADARFLANDNARACAIAAARIREGGDEEWQKALIFCQVLAGEHARASLGVSLLRETGVEDAVFFTLFDALLDGAGRAGDAKAAGTLDRMPAPTPLTLAMARAANVQLPAEVAASNQPSILRVVATSPNVPVELRLDAAERAEAAGGLPVETLRQIYMAVEFPEEALANPMSRAETGGGPLNRALLFRAALQQTVPIARAEATSRAFELARRGDRLASAARTFMPVLKGIPPSADFVWFAPEAVRAFLLGGEVEMAKAWYGVLRASSLFNPESAAAVAALRPILRLAGSAEAETWKAEDLAAWWDGVRETEAGHGKAGLLFSLFDAFDEPPPAELWAALLDEPDRLMAVIPEPALWFRLRDAAAAGRTGETVLLSLLMLGDEGPMAADPMSLRDVIWRLRAVGLDADARALAVEALLAAGL